MAQEEKTARALSDAELNGIAGGDGAGTAWICTKGTYVNVRNAPGGGEVIRCIRASGTKLPFYGWVNGWAKVQVSEGIGYIYKTYVST